MSYLDNYIAQKQVEAQSELQRINALDPESEGYLDQINAFLSKYYLTFDPQNTTKQEVNRFQSFDNMSLDDAESVNKRIMQNKLAFKLEAREARRLERLEARAERRADRKERRAERWENFKELWKEAGPGILQEMTNLVDNVFNALSSTDPNSLSNMALSELKAKNEEINAAEFAKKKAEWDKLVMLALLFMQAPLKKLAIPGQGTKSGESQFAKQGMKIEYMDLFK